MGRRGEIALDPRLSMIARMVGKCECCADIGCDHGRLGAFLGDGLSALEGKPDVIVIAGMGGATIARILQAYFERLHGARLVLQPNVAAPQLREALCRLGYAITDERIAQDGRRCYVIIQAEPGKADYNLKQLAVGPVLLERLPEELKPYAQFRLRVAKKALKGAAASDDKAKRVPLEQEIAIWEEVCACLQR